jgi:hypothetical protein
MATWWEITFTGEPTENDFAHVAEMVAQGFTSGPLVNEPGGEYEEGPATGYYAEGDPEGLTSRWVTAGEPDHPFKGDRNNCRVCGCSRRASQHDDQG